MILTCVLLVGCLFGGSSLVHAQDEPRGTQLYIDDKNIISRTTFELRKDDLIRFDAYGLATDSDLQLDAKRNGIRFFSENYRSNRRGEVKTVLFFPKVSSKITCTAYYTTQNGKSRKIRFFLEPPN